MDPSLPTTPNTSLPPEQDVPAVNMAPPAQAVHQTAMTAPQPLSAAPATSITAVPSNNKAWSYIQQRSRKIAIIAALITFAVVAPAMIYLVFKSHPSPAKSNPIASIDLPADQLQKLSSDSINVASDRTLSFNTPLIVKRDLQVNGQTTLTNVKITGSLVLPSQGTGGQANQTVTQSLAVVGTSLLQGNVTAKGSVTVGINLNVGGSGTFGSNLSANQLSVKSAVLGNATIGHLLTSGTTPSATAGVAAGGGNVSVAGNDTSGTVTITTGSGAHAQGDLVTVTFRSPYTSTPRIIVSPVGIDTAAALSDVGGIFYVSQSVNNFTIGASKMKLATAGVNYTFDYFVMQ